MGAVGLKPVATVTCTKATPSINAFPSHFPRFCLVHQLSPELNGSTMAAPPLLAQQPPYQLSAATTNVAANNNTPVAAAVKTSKNPFDTQSRPGNAFAIATAGSFGGGGGSNHYQPHGAGGYQQHNQFGGGAGHSMGAFGGSGGSGGGDTKEDRARQQSERARNPGGALHTPHWGALQPFVKNFYATTEMAQTRSQFAIDAYRAAHEITVVAGRSVPQPMQTFDETGFPAAVLAEMRDAQGFQVSDSMKPRNFVEMSSI